MNKVIEIFFLCQFIKYIKHLSKIIVQIEKNIENQDNIKVVIAFRNQIEKNFEKSIIKLSFFENEKR